VRFDLQSRLFERRELGQLFRVPLQLAILTLCLPLLAARGGTVGSQAADLVGTRQWFCYIPAMTTNYSSWPRRP
jgi:hypothetical protein